MAPCFLHANKHVPIVLEGIYIIEGRVGKKDWLVRRCAWVTLNNLHQNVKIALATILRQVPDRHLWTPGSGHFNFRRGTAGQVESLEDQIFAETGIHGFELQLKVICGQSHQCDCSDPGLKINNIVHGFFHLQSQGGVIGQTMKPGVNNSFCAFQRKSIILTKVVFPALVPAPSICVHIWSGRAILKETTK